MTWEGYEETNDVKVIHQGEASEVAYLEQRQRSAAQKHTDHALEQASAYALSAVADLAESLEWMATMTEIPAKFRGLPVTLGQWVEFINEQKRLAR